MDPGIRHSVDQTAGTPFSSIVAVVVALLFALILYYTRGMKSTKFTNLKKMSDETTAQFCSVTGAQAKDAKRYLDKYKRLDAALDAYFNDPVSRRGGGSATAASTSKLNTLFDKYKDPVNRPRADPDGDEITIDGTIKFCEDLAVNPEDVVLLSVAYELKSKRMGEWGRQGWLEGWRSLGSDNIPAMRASLPKLSQKLSSDPAYFRKVYNHTFDFGRSEGQRSLGTTGRYLPKYPRAARNGHIAAAYIIGGCKVTTVPDFTRVKWFLLSSQANSGGSCFLLHQLYLVDILEAQIRLANQAMDSAQAFWALLLPHGLKGGALSRTTSTDEDDVDMDATSEEGWKDQYTQWWFEYLEAKGGKGVSKDTWSMFLDFVRSIDAKFEKYDAEEAWPSTIDDFVEWARERLKSSA
ncbi:hypothetical protein ARMGADRAFT_1036103 [Armillaria gallica]|uniref:Defective in cullin neddylation protein n=1 Tax=Armillaria gallica TaxID=47427 RepID=A0A2H3DBL8_ARMGA|nr:hypothetical protein ARMGADRAFT_1036103 [Armillaria gallica]